MYSLIPYKRIALYTAYNLYEAREVLSKAIIEPKARYTRSDAGQYAGQIFGIWFFIGRVLAGGYHNAFMPRVSGRISKSKDGTLIDVTVTFDPVVMVFSALYFGGLLLGIALVTYGSIIAKNSVGDGILCLVTLFLIPYLIAIITYNTEAQTAIRLLSDLFEGSNPVQSG